MRCVIRPSTYLSILLVLAACKGDGTSESDVPAPAAGQRSELSPVEHLVRISMTLRGTRPSVADLELVQQDPTALEGLVDTYLDSPEFLETMKDLHAEVYLLRRDTYNILPALGALEGYNLQEIYQSQVDEPLELINYIIANERPYTEIVTADYMLTDAVTAKTYGVPFDESSDQEWQVSAWSDERPKAGILSSAEIFRRFESDGSNFHRGRANMLAGKLLCSDFDTRDIVVQGGIDIADEFAVAEAAKTEPSCIACHQTLDPLAAYFWGYMQLVHRNAVRDAILGGCQEFDYSEGIDPEYGPNHVPEYFCYPIRQYSAFMEDEWMFWNLRPPSYFGVEAKDLAEVGQLVAEDPRFSSCAARQFYGYFAQVPPEAVPFETAVELQEVFETSGFNAKELAKAAVLHPDFGAYATTGAQDAEDPVMTIKTTRPEQYARLVEDLTGYRWWSLAENPDGCKVSNNGTECWGDVDLSTSDLFGFRSMQGGIDAINITRPTHTITPTKLLTLDLLSHDAARFAIDNDWETTDPSKRKLLTLVERSTTEEAKVRAQLAALHLRILGEFVESDHEDVTLSYQLWSDVLALRGGDTAAAWTVTVATLLQDPRVLFF